MDDIDVQIKKIENCFCKGDYQQTYEAFLTLCKSYPDFDDVTAKSILARFNELNREIEKGIIPFAEQKISKNEIADSYLKCMERFEEYRRSHSKNSCVHGKEPDFWQKNRNQIRKKINLKIRGFPYPIFSVFSKLQTDDCFESGRLRLQYILLTAEAIARYLGIVLMCECREYLEKPNIPPKSLADDFQNHFLHPSSESWLYFSKQSLQWLNSNNVRLIMPELMNFFFTQPYTESNSAAALNKILNILKGLNREKIQEKPTSECRDLCGKTSPLLDQIMESLDFLMDYGLTFVSQIEVKKPRKEIPFFRHRFSTLIGNSFLPKTDDFDNSMDSESIILLANKTGESLNLDPLLIYETEDGEAPDIFFYNGEKQEGTEYSACKHGGNFFANNSKRFDTIIKEIKNFKALFTLPTGNLGGGQ